MSEEQLQTETTEEASPEVSRDDLIAAVKEAGGTNSVDVGAEVAAANAPPPEAVPAEAPAEEDRLAQVLARRVESQKKRVDADEYASNIRKQADEERQRVIDEARAEAKRLVEQEVSSLRTKFSTSPTAALRALSDNPQDVIDAVLRDGTPEARALAKLQEEARLAREDAKEGKDARQELAKFREEIAREKEELRVAQIRQSFLSEVASPEKAPYLHARCDSPEEVFERCHKLAKEWQADGMQLGRDFDRGDLVEYLERQAKERLQALSPIPAQQVSAGAPAKGPGNAPKVSANGTRTLSAAQGSERRSSPKPLSEMKPDEARAALIEEAAAARRANPDSVF